MNRGGLNFMEVAKIFSDGEDQLVALPKNFRFNSKEVFVNRVGDAVILVPKERSATGILVALDMFTEDFMSDYEKKIPPTVCDAS